MKFLAFLSIFILSSAFAHDIKIYDVKMNNVARAKASFQLNREHGRAWVFIEASHSSSNRDNSVTGFPIAVEGLSYDAQTSKIVLVHDGQEVDCAHVGRVFRTDKVVLTGKCHLSTKLVPSTFDDGFNTYPVKRLQVFLSVND